MGVPERHVELFEPARREVSGSNFATLTSLKVTHKASNITLRVLRSSGLLRSE